MVASAPRTQLQFRSPRRLTITVPHHVFVHLLQRSDEEGRSLSNLAAYLLESVVINGSTPGEPHDQPQRPGNASWSSALLQPQRPWGGNGHR